jgi:hypothetical protein
MCLVCVRVSCSHRCMCGDVSSNPVVPCAPSHHTHAQGIVPVASVDCTNPRATRTCRSFAAHQFPKVLVSGWPRAPALLYHTHEGWWLGVSPQHARVSCAG